MRGPDKFDIRFKANPTQKRFIESRAEADLFDCRKGEGKSTAIAWACYHHTRENPGAEWLIVRDTWENCRRTTQREFFRWFPPGIIGEYKAGDKEFIWKGEQIGLTGRVTFIGLDDEKDAAKVASMPLAGFALDEPAPAAGQDGSSGISEFVFDTAFAQLRQPGMKWYAAKLAQNNPDESHWTYRRFWEPGTPFLRPEDDQPPWQKPGFAAWRSDEPENAHNLPAGYYAGIRQLWAHRPDLVRRFVEGKHGFQQVGKQITPEWDDERHLTKAHHGLEPVKNVPLIMLWDGGLNPTCIITQVTPLGWWLILEAHVGEDIGMMELIEDVVRPRLTTRFEPWVISAANGNPAWRHIGDPNLRNREQTGVRRRMNTAARVIKALLGGSFRPGPIEPEDGIQPLRRVLTVGKVMVDREEAKAVWHALRGGWHYHISRGGTPGEIVKNIHSHPGDGMRYGAGILFPVRRLIAPQKPGKQAITPAQATYFATPPQTNSLGMGRRDARPSGGARSIG